MVQIYEKVTSSVSQNIRAYFRVEKGKGYLLMEGCGDEIVIIDDFGAAITIEQIGGNGQAILRTQVHVDRKYADPS